MVKQQNALKSSAFLESNTNNNKPEKKSKICAPKKKASKLKDSHLKTCQHKDKCKEIKSDLIKNNSNAKLNEKKQQNIANKNPSMYCKQSSCSPVQTNINKKTCNIACNSNKASKPSKPDRKSSDYLKKPCSSAPSKKRNPIDHCATSNQSGLTNGYVSSKRIGSANACATSKQPVSIDCAQSKKPRSTKNRAPTLFVHKQKNQTLKKL